MKPDILYEDNDLIVCIKPAGIPTQSSRIGTPDLVSILKNHLHTSSVGNPHQPYLAVIHRLDQPVEGLLVFAKNQKTAASLNRQLQSDGFGKHYLAWLCGSLPSDEGDLIDHLVKDGRSNTSSVCTKDTPGAKEARLHYKVVQHREKTSLVEITLDTGRHHQIRVQTAHAGCPILGDRKYGDPELQTSAISSLSSLPIPRQLQLFAWRLTFIHPTSGRKMEFKLPKERLPV